MRIRLKLRIDDQMMRKS